MLSVDFQNKSKYSERKALSIFMVILLKAAKNIRFVSLKILWHIKEKETSPPTFFIAKKTTTLTFVIKCGTSPFVESKLFPRICSKAGDEFVTKKVKKIQFQETQFFAGCGKKLKWTLKSPFFFSSFCRWVFWPPSASAS